MKSTRRVMSSVVIVAIIAFVCLLALPSLAVARTIKGHIVDFVAENIGNMTVTVRIDAGETKTFKASDWRLTAHLHFNEPVTIEVDEEGNVKTITGEWQARVK